MTSPEDLFLRKGKENLSRSRGPVELLHGTRNESAQAVLGRCKKKNWGGKNDAAGEGNQKIDGEGQLRETRLKGEKQVRGGTPVVNSIGPGTRSGGRKKEDC